MKKIFTLVFALGTLAVAQAQPGSRDNRSTDSRNTQTDQRDYRGYDNEKDIAYNKPYNRDDRYSDRFSMERKRDMEIAGINREYDFRIQKVRNSFYIFRYEKERQIRSLQDQRQREIKMVYYKYSNRRNDRDDRYHHHY